MGETFKRKSIIHGHWEEKNRKNDERIQPIRRKNQTIKSQSSHFDGRTQIRFWEEAKRSRGGVQKVTWASNKGRKTAQRRKSKTLDRNGKKPQHKGKIGYETSERSRKIVWKENCFDHKQANNHQRDGFQG